MADSEQPVATPKKKNNRNRKKKNDGPKNNGQKNSFKNPAEPAPAREGASCNNKPDAKAGPTSNDKTDAKAGSLSNDKAAPKISPNEGSGSATPEKKNARWEDTRQRNFQPPKKRENTNTKRFNSTREEINGSTQQHTVTGEGSRKTENSRDYRNYREERNSFNQMEMQRRQIEADRKRRWHEYFLSKPHDLLLLDRNKVILLKTVEKNRPQAQFLCKVCKYYCDNMSVVGAHIVKSAHIRQLQDYIDEVTIREMPEMTREQILKLNEFLKWQVQTESMDPINLETRRTIGVLVSELVSTNIPGCSTRLFGSSIHGLGLKTADVNIDLQVPEGAPPPETLKQVAALLRSSPHFVDVVENFHCEFPFISFKYEKSRENCSISLNNGKAVNLAALLSKYTPLDPRLTQLATLFRLWGQITQTDNAQDGTLPGFAFYLLTIFYLQKCHEPVLPVLNDFLPNSAGDPENNTAKVLSLDLSEIKQKWSTNNKQSLAQLWLGMLRFYAVEFNYTEFMVCIDSSSHKPRKTRKLFIVDPFLPTRNVARSISSNATFNYIMGCLMNTCKYFSMPQGVFGSLFKEIHVPAAKYHPELEALLMNHERINSHLIHLIMKLDYAFQQRGGGTRDDIKQLVSEVKRLIHNHDFKNIDNIPISYLEQNGVPPRHQYGKMSVSLKDARQLVSAFSANKVEYCPHYFSACFTGGKDVPKICGVCKREGHLKDDCPEEKLPPLDPLPERTAEGMQVLDRLCHYIFDKWKQSDDDLHKREKICRELEEFIRDVHPTAKLELFGSTRNGFGLKGSDMDVCLTFQDNKSGEGLYTRGFIEVLYKILKQFKDLQDLLPIATAKVPIVKFTHKATKLDGDISLYNVLALENSKLLCTYAQIDERARVLGYMMKRFSKVCHIGDASKGSLSSYAYTLLVIYFLQRCDPPVLPVLQELTENGGPPPAHIVEGCNAYFFSDLTKLDSVWPGRSKNKQSVGELWLDLLIFYTERFDMLNNVICIRCSRTVTKFEKLWISKGIAIEDPFDLAHNLGSALTRKMSLYIIKAFRKGRNHFAKPVKFSFRDARDIEAYFMNAQELTDGEPPNDRGCRVCKSIGHKERECPEKEKRQRKGMKNKNKSQNENQAPKAPVSEDDEEEDADGFSDSDGSSEQEEERDRRPREPRQPVKQAPTKSENKDGHGSIGATPPKPSPSKKVDRRNSGFQQTAPPGFVVQDPNRASGSPVVKPSNSMQRVVNPQGTTMNQTVPASPLGKSDLGIVPHSQMSVSNPALIPTIVFSNSKLSSEPLPNPAPNPVRFPFAPGQEPTRPPPGFMSISQSPQFSNSSFPMEQNSQGQKGPWLMDNFPRFPYVPMLVHRNVPVHPTPPPATVTPRPPISPAFNGHPVLGMLGPAEQLIWGQSPPPAAQPPSFPTQMPAALAKMQIGDGPPSVSSQGNFPNDLLKKDNIDHTQGRPIQHSFPPTNATMLNNTT